MYDDGSSLEAQVSSVLKEKRWCWQLACSDNLVIIQSKLSLLNIGWNVSNKGIYNNADTWEARWVKFPKVPWLRIIRFAMAISKQASVHWLAVRNSLATGGVGMLKWGYKGDVTCSFCRSCIEDREHLFFQCGFSRRIWKELLHLCLVDEVHTDWEDILQWSLQKLKSSTMKADFCRSS